MYANNAVVVYNFRAMRFVSFLFSMVTFCSISHGQGSELVQLMTPEMSFNSNRFIRCVASLADSVSVWEEQRVLEGSSPSPISLKTCSTLYETSFTFDALEGRLSPEAWVRTWEQWIEAMAKAGVNEAEDILRQWVQEGRPMEFQYSLEMSGGYYLTLAPGLFSVDFFSGF